MINLPRRTILYAQTTQNHVIHSTESPDDKKREARDDWIGLVWKETRGSGVWVLITGSVDREGAW